MRDVLSERAQEGDQIQSGEVSYDGQSPVHPAAMLDLCAACWVQFL